MQDDVNVAQVRQQVLGLERGHTELRQELQSVEQKMDRGFVAVDAKMAAGFTAITSKLDEKTTPQWQAYGLLTSVLIAIGGALFYPIKEQANRQDAALEVLRGQVIPRVEHERLWKEAEEKSKANEERLRILLDETNKQARDLGYLTGQLHPLPK